MNVFDEIVRLFHERQELYRLAGQQHLTPNQQTRLDEINAQMPLLWDAHRREIASRGRVVGTIQPAQRRAA